MAKTPTPHDAPLEAPKVAPPPAPRTLVKDQELVAMNRCAFELNKLEPKAQKRCVRWLAEKFAEEWAAELEAILGEVHRRANGTWDQDSNDPRTEQRNS